MRLSRRDTERMPEGLEAALRRAFLEGSSAAIEERHLAEIRAADAEARNAPTRATSPREARRAGSGIPVRLRLAAVVAAVALAVPAAFAGLALAGVTLPEPVDSAFETIGVDLPNQDDDETGGSGDEAGENDASSAGEPGRGDVPSAGKGTDAGGGGNPDGGGNPGGRPGESGSAGVDGDSGSKPSRHGADGRPDHAQDDETGAPAQSQQGGQGVGTPPPHAQDGVGGPPPHAQGSGSPMPQPAKPITPKPESAWPPPPVNPKPNSSGPDSTDAT